MIFSPIDTERKKKKIIPSPRRKEGAEGKSVFDYSMGRIELYMDDELVRGVSYKSKTIRRDILSKWEVLIRNQYERHVFWIKIIPNIY
jgi:hypothetical protein